MEGFRQPHRVGGLLELAESASGFALLRFDLLLEALEAYDQRSLWAAVGWFVQQNRERWSPPEEFLSRCREERPRQNQYLIRDHRGGTTLSRWNLIVPDDLLRSLSEFEGHAADA